MPNPALPPPFSTHPAHPRARHLLLALLPILLALPLFAGCAAGDTAKDGKIVVSTNIMGDLTREIVGDAAPVEVLMPPNADPHSFGISARQADTMAGARLLVLNGLGMEEGIAKNIAAARSTGVEIFAAGEFASPISVAQDGGDTSLDPHFWTDPTRVLAVVSALRDRLLTVLPEATHPGIRDRTEAYLRAVTDLDTRLSERFEAIPAERRALVTNHHVFRYLAERFDFRIVGAVIPSGTTLASPSAGDLESLRAAIAEAGVTTLFAETSQPDRLIRALAEQTNTVVEIVPLYSESLSEPGTEADTYLKMMDTNAGRIADALGA